jgi:hypothetical protein
MRTSGLSKGKNKCLCMEVGVVGDSLQGEVLPGSSSSWLGDGEAEVKCFLSFPCELPEWGFYHSLAILQPSPSVKMELLIHGGLSCAGATTVKQLPAGHLATKSALWLLVWFQGTLASTTSNRKWICLNQLQTMKQKGQKHWWPGTRHFPPSRYQTSSQIEKKFLV